MENLKDNDTKDILRIQIHLTKEAGVRLNMREIMRQVHRDVEGLKAKKVGIFACGPKGLIKTTFREAKVLKGVDRRFNFEEFDPLDSLYF